MGSVVLAGCAEGGSLTGAGGTGAGGGSGPGPGSGGAETGAGGVGAGNVGAGNVGAGNVGGSSEGGAGGGVVDKCGNGALDAGESCDGTDLGGATCASIGQGFVDGTLSCAPGCTFDTTQCNSPPNCGNGVVDAGEECDGQLLGGATCNSEGFGAGSISCSGGCLLDTAACYTCGNGTLEGPEMCDGANLDGQSCQSLGHDGGTLSCAAGCMAFNQGPCTDCGDGMIEGGEVCDGAALGGHTCQSEGFNGGTISCNASCQLNLGACTGQTCGNNILEGTEVCDAGNLNGQTCVTQGFVSGSLACNAGCNGYITSGCVGSACQNSTDDDADGFIDLADPGCTGAADNDESLWAASCNGIGGPIMDVTFANTALDVVVTGSTVGIPNAYAPTDFSDDCSTATGGEVVFKYHVYNTMSSITFSTWNPGTNFDTVLYIRTACNAAAPNEACNDDQLFTTRSEITLLNVAPGDYFIIVDGWNGQSGDYELTIDLPN